MIYISKHPNNCCVIITFINPFEKPKSNSKDYSNIFMKLIVMMDVGVENGYDEVNVQTSAKISLSAFLRQLSFVKNVTTKDLEIKPCSSLGWIKHQLSQGNGNVSKPATNKFECDDRNTDKPSSVAM